MKALVPISVAVATMALSLGIYHYATRSEQPAATRNGLRERWEYGELSFLVIYNDEKGQMKDVAYRKNLRWRGPGGEDHVESSATQLAEKMGFKIPEEKYITNGIVGLMNGLGERGWEAVDRVQDNLNTARGLEVSHLTILLKRRKN